MRTYVFRLLSLFMAVMPMASMAQKNIQSAFDAIIKCQDARITENHTFDKDPATNLKTGQSDVYRFVLPSDKINLVKNVISAFDKDRQMAYSINRGKTFNTDSDIYLAIGDASGNGICINDADCEYIYALFLPPASEDPEGKYRYAYGINYKEADGNLIGKLVVTYATTLKYRQQAEQERQFKVLRGFSNGNVIMSTIGDSKQQTWFDSLMSYIQSMSSANHQTRIALATKAYKLVSNLPQHPEVSEQDKNAAREILKTMISDKRYSESILNSLLNQCLTGIK